MRAETNTSSETLPSHDRVLDEVKQIVAEHMGIRLDAIRESHQLEADLGCDSLDRVEIMMEVEEHFDVRVSDEAAEDVRTVGDMVDGVLQLLARPRPD